MGKTQENDHQENGIPAYLEENLSGRDQTSLAPDAWIRFQYISLAPGIEKNYRFLIMQDGRLFYAANTRAFPEDRSQIYNTQLPDAPDRSLSDEAMQEIRSAVDETGFFDQPVYQESPTRDGSLLIVTVHRNEKVHEVWYANVNNPLTDLLQAVSPEAPTQQTPGQEISGLENILRQQQDLSERLDDDPAPDNGIE